MKSTIYLVVEPIQIIASDLAMNVQEYDPSAKVLIALTLKEGSEILESHAAVRLAIVHADPSAFAGSILARALSNRGAQVIFIGDAAERKDSGIFVLQRPFSAQTTAAALQRAEMSERA